MNTKQKKFYEALPLETKKDIRATARESYRDQIESCVKQIMLEEKKKNLKDRILKSNKPIRLRKPHSYMRYIAVEVTAEEHEKNTQDAIKAIQASSLKLKK